MVYFELRDRQIDTRTKISDISKVLLEWLEEIFFFSNINFISI